MKDHKDQQIEDLKQMNSLLRKSLKRTLNGLGLQNVDEEDLVKKAITYDYIFRMRKIVE